MVAGAFIAGQVPHVGKEFPHDEVAVQCCECDLSALSVQGGTRLAEQESWGGKVRSFSKTLWILTM